MYCRSWKDSTRRTSGSKDHASVAARRSATKSTTVVSISWPTPVTTGVAQPKTARTTGSALKPSRSSGEPPPRASISRSAPRASACLSAVTSAVGAPAPCTSAGTTLTRASGQRWRATFRTSLSAAEPVPVTRAICSGNRGNSFLCRSSKSPSLRSFRFSASIAAARSPAPEGRSPRTSSWYCDLAP